MKILIACEESQAVCIEMRRLGHDAFSCDIQEPSGGHPEWHILGDALQALKGGVITTMDGVRHEVGKWDMLIAHPPCTYLSNVATRAFSLRCTPAEKVCARWDSRAKAAIFFMHFTLADIPRIAVENPLGYMNSAYRKPDQIIHPYMFADSIKSDEYVTKRTCLWLKGLPKLRGNGLPRPNNVEIFGRYSSGKVKIWEEQQKSSLERSKTFKGIAKAMAEQWAGREEEDDEQQ